MSIFEFDPEQENDFFAAGIQQQYDWDYGRGAITLQELDVLPEAHGGLAQDPDYVGTDITNTSLASQDGPDVPYTLAHDFHEEVVSRLKLMGAALRLWR